MVDGDKKEMTESSPTSSPLVVFKNALKRYQDFIALDDFTLSIQRAEVLVVVGPSGSGKSTLLRVIAGLETLDSGTLSIEGKPVSVERDFSSQVGMLSQNFFLFPHLTVQENITLAPRLVLKEPQERADETALSLMRNLKVEGQAEKYPHQLSGGQQQRVAMARALAMKPKVMLFDEPTSALDPLAVVDVLDAIEGLAHQGMSLVIVTHQMGFARKVADRVLFLEAGRILEEAPKEVFFNSPNHPRTKQFLANVLRY